MLETEGLAPGHAQTCMVFHPTQKLARLWPVGTAGELSLHAAGYCELVVGIGQIRCAVAAAVVGGDGGGPLPLPFDPPT